MIDYKVFISSFLVKPFYISVRSEPTLILKAWIFSFLVTLSYSEMQSSSIFKWEPKFSLILSFFASFEIFDDVYSFIKVWEKENTAFLCVTETFGAKNWND